MIRNIFKKMVEASKQSAPTSFTNQISAQSETFKPESGRYHLYIAWGCPFAQRCALVRHMKGLEKAIGMSVVHPTLVRTRPNDANDAHVGWIFGEPGKAY